MLEIALVGGVLGGGGGNSGLDPVFVGGDHQTVNGLQLKSSMLKAT